MAEISNRINRAWRAVRRVGVRVLRVGFLLDEKVQRGGISQGPDASARPATKTRRRKGTAHRRAYGGKDDSQ